LHAALRAAGSVFPESGLPLFPSLHRCEAIPSEDVLNGEIHTHSLRYRWQLDCGRNYKPPRAPLCIGRAMRLPNTLSADCAYYGPLGSATGYNTARFGFGLFGQSNLAYMTKSRIDLRDACTSATGGAFSKLRPFNFRASLIRV
jgi:hypothetical protein